LQATQLPHSTNSLFPLITSSGLHGSTKVCIFSALNKFPPQWLFYASSVACYGYPFRSLPLEEKHCFLDEPHVSEYGYAKSKRFAFTYLELLQKVHSTNYVYGLMTNLFSTKDKYFDGNGHVFISLVRKAQEAKKNGEILSIWGEGDASRDFLSTEAASKIICDFVDQNLGIINVASGQEIKISELAQFVVDIFEIKQGYFFTGENEGVSNRYSDTTRLKSKSASFANIDIRSEIRDTLLRLK
jgi:GDP-L-fucose synthase